MDERKRENFRLLCELASDEALAEYVREEQELAAWNADHCTRAGIAEAVQSGRRLSKLSLKLALAAM